MSVQVLWIRRDIRFGSLLGGYFHNSFTKARTDRFLSVLPGVVYSSLSWHLADIGIFNDRITGKLHEFAPHAQIIHIDIDTASISRNIQVDIPIVAVAKEAITKMNEYVQECSTDKWLNLIKNWKEEHPLKMRPNDLLSPMDILKEINEQFENSIIVTDVGQHQMLVSQYAEITEGKQMIMSGGLGTMGYGLPGGIGAKIGNPDRPVIVISGDGGVQMNIQELATAVLEELPILAPMPPGRP